MPAIVYSVYKILNDLHYNIPISFVTSMTGFKKEIILEMQKENETINMQLNEMVERYSSKLGLTFADASLIKENLSSQKPSGHSPLTVIATTIYKYCKFNKKKISIKRISQITLVSPISIQRYLKILK